jgi:hypothetical protein
MGFHMEQQQSKWAST